MFHLYRNEHIGLVNVCTFEHLVCVCIRMDRKMFQHFTDGACAHTVTTTAIMTETQHAIYQ